MPVGSDNAGEAGTLQSLHQIQAIQSELERLWHESESLNAIAWALQVSLRTVARALWDAGGIREQSRRLPSHSLSRAERYEISRRLVAIESLWSVASRIWKPPCRRQPWVTG